MTAKVVLSVEAEYGLVRVIHELVHDLNNAIDMAKESDIRTELEVTEYSSGVIGLLGASEWSHLSVVTSKLLHASKQ